MTETDGEVIDLVALFRASQRRQRIGIAVTAPVAPMAWVLALREPSLVWIVLAAVITTVVAWHVAISLRKLTELKQMIANPYWARPGVRCWVQCHFDSARAEGRTAMVLLYGGRDA